MPNVSHNFRKRRHDSDYFKAGFQRFQMIWADINAMTPYSRNKIFTHSFYHLKGMLHPTWFFCMVQFDGLVVVHVFTIC